VITIGEMFMLHQLKEEGLTVSAIARRAGLDRKTVRKHLAQGPTAPRYGPREPRPQRLDPYREYVRQRLEALPTLRATRVLREIRALGYEGGYSRLTDLVRELRPVQSTGFEHRFETAPGLQAQVDFAHFKVEFTDEPGQLRVVWLFSLVLGCSRWLWGEFVFSQSLAVVLRCHLRAFAALGGVPREILYDRMKTAVLDEDGERGVIYHPKLLELAAHFGFRPRACAPYRAKTKGKVERPFGYVRDDFFLGAVFQNLDDLNTQFQRWREEVANPRRHGTTGRIVAEAFADEQPQLQPLPATPFQAILSLQRRISRDGMVSVQGNDYSVPDTTRRRVVDVHHLADEIRIYDGERLVGVHPLLEGRGQRLVAAGHRRWPPPGVRGRVRAHTPVCLLPDGHTVCRRDLAVYEHIGQQLAQAGRP
jgi:transposase